MNDQINAIFEFGMAFAISLSVLRLYRDKHIKGWSIEAVAWPTAWGFWNLYYYPSLKQWWSFTAGITVVTVNSMWIILALIYTIKHTSIKGKHG